MTIRLVEIMDVPVEWQSAHAIRALEINNHAPALAGLRKLRRDNPADYKRLLKALHIACEQRRPVGDSHIRRCARDGSVHEMRGGNARLFFFYAPSTQEIVVCTNYYSKTKDSKAEQDAAFDRCRTMRNAYFGSLASKSG